MYVFEYMSKYIILNTSNLSILVHIAYDCRGHQNVIARLSKVFKYKVYIMSFLLGFARMLFLTTGFQRKTFIQLCKTSLVIGFCLYFYYFERIQPTNFNMSDV